MFPSAQQIQGYGGPSSSRDQKDDRDRNEPDPFSSFNMAKLHDKQQERKLREKIQKKKADLEDRAAVRTFGIGDSDDSETDDEVMAIATQQAASTISNIKKKQVEQYEKYHGKTKKRSRSSSSDRSRRKKRSKKEKKKKHRRRDSSYSSSSSSSSDSSRDSRSRERRRKKEKKRKRDKERDIYIEPDVNIVKTVKKEKWSFLSTFNLAAELQHGRFMLFQKDRDGDILSCGHSKVLDVELPKYADHYVKVMGGNIFHDKVMFPVATIKSQKTQRFFTKPIKFSAKPERRFVSRSPIRSSSAGFIKLSKYKFEGYGDEEPIREPPTVAIVSENGEVVSMQRAAPEEEGNEQGTSNAPKTEDSGEKKRVLTLENASELDNVDYQLIQIRGDVNNREKQTVDLWLKFLELEARKSELVNGAEMDHKIKQTFLERQESIVQYALKANPGDERLHREMMKLKMLLNTDIAVQWNEWKAMMNKMPNSLALWDEFVNLIEQDSRHFSPTKLNDAMKMAEDNLWSMLRGVMKSHQPKPGTERFLLYLVIRRIRRLWDMGMKELAVARIQALLELNVLRPKRVDYNKERNVANMWADGVPFIGDHGAIGWFKYAEMKPTDKIDSRMNEAEREEDRNVWNNETERIGMMSRSEQDDYVLWCKYERAHELFNWKPQREFVEDNPESLVSSNELDLKEFHMTHVKELSYALCEQLGACFLNRPPTLTSLLIQFQLVSPELHKYPNGLNTFVDRMLEQMARGVGDANSTRLLEMSIARLKTCAQFMAVTDVSWREKMRQLGQVIMDVTKLVNSECKEDTRRALTMNMAITAISQLETFNLVAPNFEQSQRKRFIHDAKEAKMISDIMNRVGMTVEMYHKGKPLDEQTPEVRYVLMCLMSIFPKIPSSIEQRAYYISTLVIGKSIRNHNLTPQDKIRASHILEDLEMKIKEGESDFSPLYPDIHEVLEKVFGTELVLCRALRLNHIYCNWSSDHHLLHRELSRMTDEYYNTFDTIHLERFHEHMMWLWKTDKRRTQIPTFMNVLIRKGNDLYPLNPFVIRETILNRISGPPAIKLFLELSEFAKGKNCFTHSVARMFAAHEHFTRVMARSESAYDLTQGKRMIGVYVEEAKRHKDPLLWRYALLLANQSRNNKLVDEVYTQAASQCMWSRDLHLDLAEAWPDKIDDVQKLMAEKNLRVRSDVDEIDVIRKKYGLKDEEEEMQLDESELAELME